MFLAAATSQVQAEKIAPLSGVNADSLPVPRNVKELLFYVQRDPDANTVVYALNLDDKGDLNEDEPVKIFWIRYKEGGKIQELNYIQRKFAYGLNVTKINRELYELRFVSYNKLPLVLRKNAEGKFQVYTAIKGKQAELDRIFIRIEGGTFWVPNVLYVELKGREPGSGKTVVSRFKP